ncbi:MAG TPA: NUDIX domain-containing protein [Acidimicrobiales bacterium]|nr:NUDIX domain-containing protein [Acidimicrobiales bacterium]
MGALDPACTALGDILDAHTPTPGAEAADVARIRAAVASGDPWSRTRPLHVTGSAIVVHPPTRRVLLRWHDRMGSWLQVGGHADAGETDPLAIARREAEEETGLGDLVPWPDRVRPGLVHVVVVPVPASATEPAHEHADLRFVLATARPDEVTPETATARLRWLAMPEAFDLVVEENLRTTLTRVAALLDT